MHVRRLLAVVAVLAVALMVAACGAQGSSHHKHYSSVYVSDDGRVYCKSYKQQQDNSFILIWYILYANSQPVIVTSPSSLSSSTMAGASWQQTSVSASRAAGFSKTDEVVEDDESGEPGTDNLEAESDVAQGDEVIDDNTDPSDVQVDTGDNGGDTGDDGGDGGGDNGGDGGGDAGGGDAGGGE